MNTFWIRNYPLCDQYQFLQIPPLLLSYLSHTANDHDETDIMIFQCVPNPSNPTMRKQHGLNITVI